MIATNLLSWTVGPKPVDRNDVFTLRSKYYHKGKPKFVGRNDDKNKKFIVIALLLTNYYMTEYYGYI